MKCVLLGLCIILMVGCTSISYDGKSMSIISTKEYKQIDVQVWRKGDDIYIILHAQGVTNNAEGFIKNLNEGITKGIVTGLKSGIGTP